MRGQEREADEVAAAIRRMLRALERRAATGDDQAAVELVQLARDAQQAARVGLVVAHAHGYSYRDLALWVGVSRQAIAERIGRASHDRS